MAEKIARQRQKEQDPMKRRENFSAVEDNFTPEQAALEASRCLSCKNARCKQGCPVSIDIPSFIKKIKENDLEGAGDIIRQSSMLPSVCGRVCPQEKQCEGNCILGIKGEPVAIGALERYVGDATAAKKVNIVENGKKVAIVGSGCAGMSAAADLRNAGFEVSIFEALHELGGVLRYGIPPFRLPRTVLDREIKALEEMGVKFYKNVVVGKSITLKQLKEEGYSAIFICSGAGLPKMMNIPGENLNGVYSANEFLTRVNLMHAQSPDTPTPLKIGKTAAIIGGGNVAMDAARTALRLGAEVHIVYRRSEAELPARVEEVHHAKEEGIIFDLLTNPTEILADENGWVKGMKCVKMELGEPDASGRRKPVEIEGSEYVMDLDAVIMSLGTSPNPLISSTTKGLDVNKRQCIIAEEETGKTTKTGVYAGGDAVTGAATVILAMGAGKAGAKGIDEYLSNK